MDADRLAERLPEFWQGDKDRRHVRLRYTPDGADGSTQRLWP